jgi:hypothetical protein
MRNPEEIKKRITGDIRELNRRLVTVAISLEKESRKNPIVRTPPGHILASLYRKAINTARAIESLKGEKLIEEAWVLLRVLLESHVNFFYFFQNDPSLMVQRYADASILDKLKHLREVDFYKGTSLASIHSREKWEATEKEIRGRYTDSEFKALRRHGFSGKSFEARAETVGLKVMYEACYRIASRSVHMFDPAETIFSHFLSEKKGEHQELLRLRRAQLERNQNMLLGRLSYFWAKFTENALREAELILLGLGYEKYCDKTSGVGNDEVPDPTGSFYIWRF